MTQFNNQEESKDGEPQQQEEVSDTSTTLTTNFWEYMALFETQPFGDNISQTTRMLTVMRHSFAQKISKAEGDFQRLS